MQAADRPSPATSTSRYHYYLIAILLPFVLLALLEGLLRLSGQHRDYPLLIPATTDGYLQLNPEVIKRYFADPSQAPAIAPDSQFVLAEKAADSMRIVFMGGSSAAGFPYGRFGSPAAMLQHRLKLQYPDRRFEVINTAMSAINSYSLLDFSDEIIALQPDLVLIYAGHNEYLGIMGVGSAFASGLNRASTLAWLKLRKLALFQLLQRLYLTLSPGQTVDHSSRTLMATMAAQQHIEYDSALYHAGLQQFAANMRLVLQRFSAAGVPVVLSTLAANEADQPPFVSPPLPVLSAKNIASLQHAIANSPPHAGLEFALAQQLQQQGQHQQALLHYSKASDFDALRFRAPSAINQIIRQLSTEFALPLAQGQQYLRAASPNGIIGNSLMLEHLHPNARGYFLLAEAFLAAMAPQLPPVPLAADIKPNDAWATQPLHASDQLLAEFKIRLLTADYPFRQSAKTVSFGPQLNLEQQLAYQRSEGLDWLAASEQLLRHYQQQHDAANAARVAAQLADALPFRADLASLAGQLYFASQQLQLAEYYQRSALCLTPDAIPAMLMLSRTLYFSQQYTQALELVEQLLQRSPEHPVALRQQQQLRQLLQQQDTR